MDIEDINLDQAKVDALVKDLASIGDIKIPADPTKVGIQVLSGCLSDIMERRQRLVGISNRILVLAQRTEARSLEAESELKIAIDDLMVNDSEVRSAPNQNARQARARFKTVDLKRRHSRLREMTVVWKSVQTVCDNILETLKLAKESVSKMVSIYEMELQSKLLVKIR